MKALIVFLFFIFIILLYLFFYKKKNNILLIIPIISCFNFLVPFSDSEYYMAGLASKFSVDSTAIALLSILVYFLMIKNIKKDFLYFVIFLLVIYPLYQLYTLDLIIDLPKYVGSYSILLSIFLCYFIAFNVAYDTYFVNKFLSFINYTAIYNGIISIMQIITKKSLLFNYWDGSILYTVGGTNSYRAIGIIGSNNAAGNLGALLFTICCFNFIKSKDRISLVACILSVIAIALSQTRVAMLALVIVFILFSIYKAFKFDFKIKKRNIYIGIMLITIISIATYLFGYSVYEELFINRGNTESSRIVQFAEVFDNAVLKHPIWGIGLGQWRAYMYYTYDVINLYIHSQYLNVLAEQGVISFLVFVFINLYPLYKILISNYLSLNYRVLALFLFIVNIIVSNANPNQFYLLNNIFYYMVIFMVYGMSKQTSK